MKTAIQESNPLNFTDGGKVAGPLVEDGATVDAGFAWLPPWAVHTKNKQLAANLLYVGDGPNQTYAAREYCDVTGVTTPLMMASGHGRLETVKRLLQAGADVHAVDEHGHNALFWALRWDKGESAKELLRWGARLTDDALCGPVRNGNEAVVALLIGKQANPNAVFRRFDEDEMWPDGETLLGYAVTIAGILNYSKEIIKLLVDAGSDVNQPTKWNVWRRRGAKVARSLGPTLPLQIAACRGLEDVMEWLWKAGAKGTLPEAMADCSLERAVCGNSPGVVKLLIKAGVDVNVTGETTGQRPFELARRKACPEIIEALQKAGAW